MRELSATGDVAAHKWTIDPGKFVIRVGDSSENTPLNSELTLKLAMSASRQVKQHRLR